MSDVESLRDTITPKSDQMNADDLIAGPVTITLTGVTRGTAEQPIKLAYQGDNGKPYMPCKSMRRVMIHAWTDDGRAWVGKSMTLYSDPEVSFGGVKVGGIRISHLSHIPRQLDIALTTTRGKRKPYSVQPLVVSVPSYPAEVFTEKLPAMLAAIQAKKMTIEQVVAHCNKTGALSADQIQQLKEQETF